MDFLPTQAMFDAFARLSGDSNPIHVDPGFAAASGFGRPVAHGAMLTGWLMAAAANSGIEGHLQSTSATFPAPTYADEPLTAVKVDGIWQLVRAGDGTCVCALLINAPVPVVVAPEGKPAGLPLELGMQTSLSRTILASDWKAMAELCGVTGQQVGAMFGLAALSTLLGMTLPGQGTNYLKQATQWHGAIQPGQTIDATVTISQLRSDKKIVDLETRVMADTVLIASGRALVSARDVTGAFTLEPKAT